MKIAVYGSRRQDEIAPLLSAFFDSLARAGVEVVMHRKIYDVLIRLIPARLACVRQVVGTPEFSADVALSIGGDGTFLRTAMWVGDKQIPILGINGGHLGYLAGAGIDELPQVVDELVSGNFQAENRALLQVTSPEVPVWPYALNEVALTKEDSASLVTAETYLDGEKLASYRSDGLIIATPTGSTAYSLSVGGPIVAPGAPVWVLSPIAAHSLGMRPMVVDDDASMEVTVTGRGNKFRLALDGRACTLPIGTKVTLHKAPFCVKVVVRPGHNFTKALREKLHWNE